MKGRERGAVLVVAVLLVVALLLMAHALLAVARTSWSVSRSHARATELDAAAQGAVEEALRGGWRSWMDSVPAGGVRTFVDSLPPDMARTVTWRRLDAESWLVGGQAWKDPTPPMSLRRLVWLYDPARRVSELVGVISTGVGAPVRLSGAVSADMAPVLATVDRIALGRFGLDRLLAVAEPVGPTGTPAPVDARGVCDTAAAWNWGDPEGAPAPCADHFVLAGSPVDVTLLGGMGQGVLVVDGDLRLEGSAAFHGLLLASGSVSLTDVASVEGRIVALGGIDVAASARVTGSASAARRALTAVRDRLGLAVLLHPARRLGPG